LGGPGDVEIANIIETKLRASVDDAPAIVNVAGKTTLMELCQLIKFCRLLLTNDTGPMHLADAVGTPVVAVFGSTSAELTGPLNKHSRVVREPVECSPCFLRECPIDFRCMNGVTVDRVVRTVLELWPETEKARPRA
jgi:heptosyltransferase-2